MELTQQDIADVKQLVNLESKINKISGEEVNLITDEIFQKQPFFLTVLLGFRFDIELEEMEEIIKIYLLIWEYFRTSKKVQTIKVTQEHFETTQAKFFSMLQYIEGEPREVNKSRIYEADFNKLKSKVLFAVVLKRFTTSPILEKMDGRNKGIILMGIKSFIVCFETV